MSVRFVLMLGVVAGLTLAAPGQVVRNRVVQTVDTSKVTFVKGNVHRMARSEFDAGKVESALPMERVTIAFKLSDAQQADLEKLLKEQGNPSSSNYHKWLTPEEYGKRFGLSESDYAKVTSWIKSQGLKIVDSPASRTYVAFSGTAAQVSAALHTEIRNYMVGGEKHYANATEPAVPSALTDVVQGFRSLNDFRPKPRRIETRKVNPSFTSSISGNHYLAPDDVATIYNIKGLYSAGIDGTGQKLVVVGQTDIIPSDITAFRTVSGLPANTPTVVLVPGSSDPGIVSGDIGEANLDLQWSGAIARNAHIIYVNSKNGVFDSLQYAIANNLAPVISISYGSCEPNFTSSEVSILNSWGQQANAQGITVSASSGDSGAADCDYSSTAKLASATHGLAVDIPASLPSVTGVGGTAFNEGTDTYWSTTNNSSNGSALSYIPEGGWNDTAAASDLSSSGGGKSILFARPSWQTATGLPSGTFRAVPDISFNASSSHDGYLACSQGSCVNGYRDADNFLTVFGGTSAGAPVFAGLVTLLNQKMGVAQGNVNPTLYSLAASTPAAFHDVTSGDNKVPCTAGSTDCPTEGVIGYAAGAGYDMVTGLGSVDAFVLASAWGGGTVANPDFQLASTPSSMTLSSGGSGNAVVTATALNGFDGAITWSCGVSSALTSLASCSVTPDSSSPNTKATVTVTALKKTSSLHKSGTSLWLLAAGVSFGFLLISNKSQRQTGRFISGLAMVLLAAAVLGAAVGCGGGGGGSSTTSNNISSSPVTGTVSVQAISGSITHTLSLTVTVQ